MYISCTVYCLASTLYTLQYCSVLYSTTEYSIVSREGVWLCTVLVLCVYTLLYCYTVLQSTVLCLGKVSDCVQYLYCVCTHCSTVVYSTVLQSTVLCLGKVSDCVQYLYCVCTHCSTVVYSTVLQSTVLCLGKVLLRRWRTVVVSMVVWLSTKWLATFTSQLASTFSPQSLLADLTHIDSFLVLLHGQVYTNRLHYRSCLSCTGS